MTYAADARRRALAAERDRVRRERRRAAIMVVPVEVTQDDIDELVERRRLAEWDEGSRDAIGETIGQLVRDYCNTTRGQAE